MTKHDLRIAGIAIALVVVIGLGIGYAVGWMTRPAVDRAPQDGAPVFADEDVFADEGGTAQGVPGYDNIYVNDYADLLDEGAERDITADLKELYRETGVEMTVLTIGSLRDYGHEGPIEPFATRLFNTWGIGNAERNDGVLILVARRDRQMRIEIGRGYGTEWDGRMARVIDDAFLPAFRNDEYQAGILRGVDETIRTVAGVYPGEFGDSHGTLQRGFREIGRWFRGIGDWLWAVVAVPLGAVALGVRQWMRNRPRPCPQCATVMARLPEDVDDAHLDGGQRLEEYLKSVDYDVWHCPNCDHLSIHGYRNWISSRSVCPQCSYRTMETDTTILEHATTSSTGRKRLDYHCEHCGYENSETRTIPRKSKSSSGSGGGSFGGGSSSGGGASGSW